MIVTETPLDRFYRALGSGDLAAARACFSPHGQLWHGYDAKLLSIEEAVTGWEQVIAASTRSAISDIRRTPTPDGFVQRHAWTMVTKSGKAMSWAVCVFAVIENDQILRLDEYIDRAGVIALNGDLVPGMAATVAA